MLLALSMTHGKRAGTHAPERSMKSIIRGWLAGIMAVTMSAQALLVTVKGKDRVDCRRTHQLHNRCRGARCPAR